MRKTSMGMRAFATGLSVLLALGGAPVAVIAEEAEPQGIEQAAEEPVDDQADGQTDDEQATTDGAAPVEAPADEALTENGTDQGEPVTSSDMGDAATDDAVEVTTDGTDDEVEVSVDGKPAAEQPAATDEGAVLQTQSDGVALQAQGGATVSYRTHIQRKGWQGWRKNGKKSGTSGKGLRLEGIKVKLSGVSGGIQYRTHVQKKGWQGWKSNGQMSGTKGKGLRLEAIQLRLTGDAASQYDVWYRVHAQKFGWMGWTANGASAGTEGYGYRLEAIQIRLVPKGQSAPGSTANPFSKKDNTFVLQGDGYRIELPAEWKGKVTIGNDSYGDTCVFLNGSKHSVVHVGLRDAYLGRAWASSNKKYAEGSVKLKNGKTAYIGGSSENGYGFVVELKTGKYLVIGARNMKAQNKVIPGFSTEYEAQQIGWLQSLCTRTYGSNPYDNSVTFFCLQEMAKRLTIL